MAPTEAENGSKAAAEAAPAEEPAAKKQKTNDSATKDDEGKDGAKPYAHQSLSCSSMTMEATPDAPPPGAVGGLPPPLPKMDQQDDNPCRNWQYRWDSPCNRLCCHTHPTNCPCADIACDGCGLSIVRPKGAGTAGMNGLEPFTRYVCLECSVDERYDAEHWGTHLCEECFDSAKVLHLGSDGVSPHRTWLRISPSGEHTRVSSRPAVEGVTYREVTAEDLTTYPAEGVSGELCPVCFTFDIGPDNPVSSLPGCAARAHFRCCASGCLGLLRADGRLLYADSPGGNGRLPPATYFCKECRDEERRAIEVEAVLDEMAALVARGFGKRDAVERLKAAHRLNPVRPKVNRHLHEALDKALIAADA